MPSNAAVSVAATQQVLTTLIDYAGGTNATYVGTATAGSATSAAFWQIKKIVYDTNNNPTSITWANSANSTNVWDNRASLTYS